MLSAARSRTALLALTGASFVGLLAGCSSTATTADSGAGSGTSSSPSSASTSGTAGTGSTSSSASGSYKDGTYTEDGSYTSPGGQETISVKLTLAADTVKSVTVSTVKADPTGTQYEKQFSGGIAAVVVGKKIDDLNVSQVAGSSLTSQGFNAAVTKIKADAKA